MNARKREYCRLLSPGWRSHGSRSSARWMGRLLPIFGPGIGPQSGPAGVFGFRVGAMFDLGAVVGHDADAFGVAGGAGAGGAGAAPADDGHVAVPLVGVHEDEVAVVQVGGDPV